MRTPMVTIGTDCEPYGAGERFALPEQGERFRDAEVQALRAKIQAFKDAIERHDLVMEREADADGWVTGYRCKTGSWHSILALARSEP